jgi:hypothetical protein
MLTKIVKGGSIMSPKGELHTSVDDCRLSFDSLGYEDCFIPLQAMF